MINKFEEENPDLVKDMKDEENKTEEEKEKELTEEESKKDRDSRLSYDGVKSGLSSTLEPLPPSPFECPPNPENRNFNENDILGSFDRDERGNLVLLENSKGQIVDKNGNLVNERGFLIDKVSGDVVDKDKRKSMFKAEDLDEQGDIPAPFNLERFNFNPLELLGNLDFNPKTNKPLSLL